MNSDPGNDLMPLIGKLASIMTLSEDERYAIQGLPRTRRRLGAREDISREGDRPSQCCLILEGWAFRYKTLGNGNRQILSFHLPGEIPDLQGLHLRHMDHNLSTLTECTVVFIPHNGLQALISEFPALTAELWRQTLVDAAIYRGWMTSIGQRSAAERIAHVFCELYTKLHSLGLAHDYSCAVPLTQGKLGDAIGITTIHVNRVLQSLRVAGLITYKSGKLTIHEWSALTKLAQFDPAYLHLNPKVGL
ncbi:Crp/Fnr family transcriptional regulator [Methylobacterium sp.]|uniref:Crp/Fnr family transcriptional regulator n=1 Tax=Methylobacterium sp. TaxID=409 RepID=UPI003B01DB18